MHRKMKILHNEKATGPGLINQIAGLIKPSDKRFFYQHMLSSLDSPGTPLLMQTGRQRDIQNINIRTLHQFCIALKPVASELRCPPLCRFSGPARHGRQFTDP